MSHIDTTQPDTSATPATSTSTKAKAEADPPISTGTATSTRNLPGIWIGIDLGTTNTTAAFYTTSKSKAKLIRFRPQFAKRTNQGKYGRILPSAVSYSRNEKVTLMRDGNGKRRNASAIGIEALRAKEHNALHDNDNNATETKEGNKGKGDGEDERDCVVLSSVKRIWGMDAKQVRNELIQDPTFLHGCPFNVIINDGKNEVRLSISKSNVKSNTTKESDADADMDKDTISPMDVAEQLLHTIREEATAYFQREKETPVGMNIGHDDGSDEATLNVRHCTITVPAHFSRNRREQMVQAAKNAGFDGCVSTMVESTAAAMAYGLFVAPKRTVTVTANKRNKEGALEKEVKIQTSRKIMVFDMGGGTTDVTIAEMMHSDGDGNGSGNNSDASFKVLGTAGERRLGGDDMDLKLAEYIKTKLNAENSKDMNMDDKERWNRLRLSCRDAKEKLCGDGKDELPASKADIRVGDGDETIVITQETFHEEISSIVERAANLVKKALDECSCSFESIDEVILVGGATRTPSIRTMLQSKFRNELCCSIDPYAAVAQGAAIQSAIVSQLVPKHELRNALMLDALPHPIGVLVEEDMYVPILERGMELPAMHYASFRLGDVRQKGVTVIAVEDIGDDLPLERIGEFTFLLHRLTDEQYDSMEDDGGRMIDVGMTVESSGKFIVSIFDKNDPDHLRKKKWYQEWKKKQQRDDSTAKTVYALGDTIGKDKIRSESLVKEEILLIFGCAVLFLFYVGVKMVFQ